MSKYQQSKDQLNSVGPGFCLEKWTTSFINLQSGFTHACHHPAPHHIPQEEVLIDASAIFNSKHLKEQRKIMLQGGRPGECSYCWKVEDSSPDIFSDRHIVGSMPKNNQHFDIIANSPSDNNFNPVTLEIGFSNACNFACAYCNPNASSTWATEIRQHGAYPTSDNYNAVIVDYYSLKEENPYVNAFWKQWSDFYLGLENLRITGGEPLMSKNTYKVIDKVIEQPNPKMKLTINTNLGVSDDQISKLINKAKLIKGIKQFEIHTSNESYGDKSNYIRYGIDYDKWISNVDRVLSELPEVRVGFMTTYNLLSVTSFTEFLKDIYTLKQQYGEDRIVVSVTYLRDPAFLDIRLLPKSWKIYLDATLDYLETEFKHPETTERFKQVISYFDTEIENIENKKKDLVVFLNEYDRRRGTNFAATFPEYLQWISTIDQNLL
jgi:organic radical activating enzyme